MATRTQHHTCLISRARNILGNNDFIFYLMAEQASYIVNYNLAFKIIACFKALLSTWRSNIAFFLHFCTTLYVYTNHVVCDTVLSSHFIHSSLFLIRSFTLKIKRKRKKKKVRVHCADRRRQP